MLSCRRKQIWVVLVWFKTDFNSKVGVGKVKVFRDGGKALSQLSYKQQISRDVTIS